MDRVLFVDGANKELRALRRGLRPLRDRWDMTFTTDVEQALGLVDEGGVDVVVCDDDLRATDGTTFLQTVRRHDPATLRVLLRRGSDAGTAMRAARVAHQVFSKPCDAETVHATVDRALRLRSMIDSAATRAFVTDLDSLPGAPVIHAELTEALSDPEVGLDVVAAIVGKDQSVAAKVMQLVNSAFFGLASPITSLERAAVYLGIDALRGLVLHVEVIRAFQAAADPSRARVIEEFSAHAFEVASVAEAIVGRGPAGGEAFTAGLLHDIGKLVLVIERFEQWAAVRAAARVSNTHILEHEREHLGVTHAEIGAALLGLWGLPFNIVEAVAFHHSPAEAARPDFSLAGAIHVADALTHEARGETPGRGGPALDHDYLRRTQVSSLLDDWRARQHHTTTSATRG